MIDEDGKAKQSALNPRDVLLYRSHVPHDPVDADVQYVLKERNVLQKDNSTKKELKVLWK